MVVVSIKTLLFYYSDSSRPFSTGCRLRSCGDKCVLSSKLEVLFGINIKGSHKHDLPKLLIIIVIT